MSKPAKSGPSAQKIEEMPFEEALKRLEGILDEMETGDLPLESTLARYEEGTKLLGHCRNRLNEAELKISELEKKASGALETRPITLETDISMG